MAARGTLAGVEAVSKKSALREKAIAEFKRRSVKRRQRLADHYFAKYGRLPWTYRNVTLTHGAERKGETVSGRIPNLRSDVLTFEPDDALECQLVASYLNMHPAQVDYPFCRRIYQRSLWKAQAFYEGCQAQREAYRELLFKDIYMMVVPW